MQVLQVVPGQRVSGTARARQVRTKMLKKKDISEICAQHQKQKNIKFHKLEIGLQKVLLPIIIAFFMSFPFPSADKT